MEFADGRYEGWKVTTVTKRNTRREEGETWSQGARGSHGSSAAPIAASGGTVAPLREGVAGRLQGLT